MPSFSWTVATRFSRPGDQRFSLGGMTGELGDRADDGEQGGEVLRVGHAEHGQTQVYQGFELLGRGESAGQYQVGLLGQDDLGVQLAKAAADIGRLFGFRRVVGEGIAPDDLRTGADGEQDLGVAGGERDDPLSRGGQADRLTDPIGQDDGGGGGRGEWGRRSRRSRPEPGWLPGGS